jgi:pyruvate dehydrogenase (quinone)
MSARAWGQALAADRPTVLDLRTDPSIPPIPPHATFEQAREAAMTLLKATRTGGPCSGKDS